MKLPVFILLAAGGALSCAAAKAGEPRFGALALTPPQTAKAGDTRTPLSPLVLPAPQLSETRAVRGPDGTPHIVCEEVPNPRYEKAREQLRLIKEQQR
jgi:hypothetical protein